MLDASVNKQAFLRLSLNDVRIVVSNDLCIVSHAPWCMDVQPAFSSDIFRAAFMFRFL